MTTLEVKNTLKRSATLLVTENGFATALSMSLAGTFLTGWFLELGATPQQLGLALAASGIGSLGMLATNSMLHHTGSRRKLALIDLGVVRLLRVVLSLLPLLLLWGAGRHSLLYPSMACVLVGSFFGNSAEITRRSWISDLVLPGERGKFFARRIMVGSTVNVIIMLGGAWFIDLFERKGQTLDGLQWLIGFGALSGVVSWILIYNTYEPPMSMPRRQVGFFEALVIPWLRPRFRMMLVFTTAWSLAIGFGANFFNFYMIDKSQLGISYTAAAVVNTVGEVAAVIAAPFFGSWVDRVGTKKVFLVAGLAKAIFPFFWIFVTPTTWWPLILINLLSVFNSAIGICWMRVTLNIAPQANQAAFLSMYQVASNLANAVGAIVGGWFVETMCRDYPQGLAKLGGFILLPVHVLFITSTVLRFGAMLLLPLVREPKGALIPTK